MNKSEKIGYYNNETGEILSEDIVDAIKNEEKSNYYKQLFWKYKNNKNELSLSEIEELRGVIKKRELARQRNKKAVYLKYSDGFYMVANNTEDNLKQLSFEANGFLHLLGFNINKSGVIIYKNNKNIRSFEKLRLLLGVSERVWRRIKKELDEFNVIKKERVNNEIVLIVNPKYLGTSYEVTEYKFMVWHTYFKEYLDDIDYLYLVKQFGIDLSLE